MVAVPDAQQLLQVIAHLIVILGAVHLALQAAHARAQFGQDVLHAFEVSPGSLQAPQCFLAAGAVQPDPGGLLEELAPLVSPQGECGIDQPLSDNRVGALGQPGL